MTTTSSDVPMKGLVPLLEALAKVRTERDDAELVIIGKPKGKSKIPALIDRLGLADAVQFVSGVTTERIVELYAETEVAVVPSLYEGFSLPAVEAMACGVPLVATTGGALPEVVGTDGETGLLVPPGDPDALAAHAAARARRRRPARPHRRRRPQRACSTASPGAQTAVGTVENYRALLDARAAAGARARHAPDADRRLRPPRPARRATGCSTWAAAAGATRSRRCGAARRVVALDYDAGELKEVRAIVGAMIEARRDRRRRARRRGQRRRAALPFPDDSFDRIIASEVLEHLWDDERAIAELVRVLRPGGRLAVTVPTRWPERVSWAINYRYHDTPGGHVRIYRQHELEQKLERAGLWLRGSHHAHALHSPYWWLKCTFGLDNTGAWPVRKYHDFLVVPDRTPAPVGRDASTARSTRCWARAWSSTRRRSGRMTVTAHALLPDVDGVVDRAPSSRRPSTPSRRSSCPTATSRGRPAATPTRGTWSRRRWRSTSAAATTSRAPRTTGSRGKQRADGGWHAYYLGDEIEDPTLDTNVTCYVATGAWHHHLVTGDTAYLRGAVADGRGRHRLRARLPARDRRDRVARRRPRRRRAAHRFVEHPPQPEVRDRDRRAARPRTPRLGAVARRARHRHRAPPRRVPRQGPLGDGLVLPDPRRRAARLPGRRTRVADALGARSSSRAAASAACPTARGSPRPRRASW